jgi:hypothetical protein
LLAIVDELVAEMTVVVIPHNPVRTWRRFSESAIAPDKEVLLYQLLAQGDSKRRAILARIRDENSRVHLLP